VQSYCFSAEPTKFFPNFFQKNVIFHVFCPKNSQKRQTILVCHKKMVLLRVIWNARPLSMAKREPKVGNILSHLNVPDSPTIKKKTKK